MRLSFILPKVEPDNLQLPRVCPYPGYGGKHFRPLQSLRCGHTFRVYPAGVSRDHFSPRVEGLTVVLYLLGLSYGAVSLLLEALGLSMSKTLVYLSVQEAAWRVPGMKRKQVFKGVRTPALGSDVTSVKGKGKWYPIGVAVDAVS